MTRQEKIEQAIMTGDPVKAAVQLFGGNESDRCLWGWYCGHMGRDVFRELVYQKWRENEVEGQPRNPAAAFQKLLKLALPKTHG